MSEPKSRSTLSVTFSIDSLYGYSGWFHGYSHNGFTISFGILSIAIFIQFVRKNYR